MMTRNEQDAYWSTQLSKLKRAGLLRQSTPRNQGYRQKLHNWKGGAITLNAGVDDSESWVHVDITMTGNFKQSWFMRLRQRAEALGSAVEQDLAASGDTGNTEWIWEPREQEGESWIILRRHGLDLSEKQSREEGQLWTTRAVAAFLRSFGPFLDTM
jgi:hypothetical protein